MSLSRVLIIDDDPDLSALIDSVATGLGCETYICDDATTLDAVYRSDLSAIVLDIMMPNVDGIEVLRKLAQKKCEAGIIIVSGSDPAILHSVEKIALERDLNYVGTLRKPFVPQNLVGMLNKARLNNIGRVPRHHPLEDTDTKLPTSDELVVMFQPKIDMRTLDFSSAEALVRWQHPTKGLLAPKFFIPEAEASGQIDALTDMIVHKALAQANEWMRNDLIVTLSINVSVRTLSDITLPDRLEGMLETYRIDPSNIILEITETWFNDDPVNSLDSLTRLALKGFRISIDDFGTGYSSISQLSRIPFSELKIDRSFVKHAPVNSQARKILESSVELGHHLNMKVVAEGVETQEQWDLVQNAHCDECQGFFIAKPLPAGSTPAWLARWRAMNKARQPEDPNGQVTASKRLSDVKM